MNRRFLATLSLVLLSGQAFLPADTQAAGTTKKPAATKPKEYPKMMLGCCPNVSVQCLRCIRANVPEFGVNNIVVFQFRLKKESQQVEKGDGRIRIGRITARDPALGQTFNVTTGDSSTYTPDILTHDWQVGQSGDGFCWFRVPERVGAIEAFFENSKAYPLNIEVPK